jgi:propionate CoA-transferase
MKKVDVLTAAEAAELVQDGDALLICGCENLLSPNTLLRALGDRYQATGAPRDLTEIHPIIVGMGEGLGLENLAHPGFVKRAIGSGYSYLKTSRYTKLLKEDAFEAHVLPMGTIFQIIRDTAAGKDFTLTKVGLQTFVDPGLEGGRLNARAEVSLATPVDIGGETWLKYERFPAQVAFLRGTTADEFGNISLEGEPVSLGVRSIAMAVKNSGGKVIVQVQRMTGGNCLAPRSVEIPGIFVDAVVIDPEQPRSGGVVLNPALTGEIRLPSTAIQPLPIGLDRIVASRAAAEIVNNDIVNIGVGMPIGVPSIIAEQGLTHQVTFFPEHGSIGGVPAERAAFGANINPAAIIDSTDVFDFFCGGGLGISFLGFGQIDRFGNVNVSKFSGIVPGCGGFIDITHKTRRLVFCGSFTAGGIDVNYKDGNLQIRSEGRNFKFVPDVEQVTFNGKQGILKGQRVLYVTERAVFSLQEGGLMLEEHAPGIDVRKQILDLIPFGVAVSSSLKIMSARYFL